MRIADPAAGARGLICFSPVATPPSAAPHSTHKRLDDLLLAREARGLRWAIVGRLVLIGLGVVVVPLTSPTRTDLAFTFALLALGAGVCAYAYRLARQMRKLALAGWMCVSFDLITLAALPLSWYHAVGGAEMSPAFLLKNDLLLLCLMLIGANGLAFKPVYPLTLTAASYVVYAVILVNAVHDGRMIFSADLVRAVMADTVHPPIFFFRMLTIGFFGGVFVWLGRTGQRLVRDAVELEHANEEIRRRQAEWVMQGRLSALAGLVAGVAHEVNTPLGVLSSSVQTVESGVERLSTEINEDERKRHARTFGVLTRSACDARRAVDRISGLVSRLKDFAGVDRSDRQEADLEAALDQTLDLIAAEVRGAIRIEKGYAGIPAVVCRPKEINQVFYTLLTNAFEAMKGDGTLRVRTAAADGVVSVEIADNGPGIEPEQLARLFDIGFASKQERVGMRLGLPMARYVVESHGGRIDAQSEAGAGAAFRVELPAPRTP